MKSLSVGFERALVYAKSSDCLFNPVYREATEERQNSGYWKGFHNSADRPTMRYELLGVVPEGGQWKWQESVAKEAVQNYAEYLADCPDTSLEEYWLNTGKEKRFIRRREHLTKGQNKGVEHWIPPSEGVLLSSNWADILASENDLGSLGLSFDTPKRVDYVKRLLEMAADEDTIILDSFAGSGTTAHAVLRLNEEDGGNRKFILVECEDYADAITAERVRRVINGVPEAKDKVLREGLGSSFTYCNLGEPIDTEGLLTGESLPKYTTLAAYVLHTCSGISAGANDLEPKDDDGLFYCDGEQDYYLLYRPDLEWLRSHDAMFNAERARRIAQHNQAEGRKAVAFAPGKYIGQRELTSMGIRFCQLPYQIHQRL